jgi:hypothetical protein
MYRLIVRELVLSARRSGLWITVAVHALLSLAFLEAWGGTSGAPILSGTSLYTQLIALQFAFVLVAAPWMAARVMAPSTQRDTPRMSLLFGVDAADILRAQSIVAAIWVLLLCAAAWPAALLAQQMSPLAGGVPGVDQLVIFGGAGAAALLTTGVARWIDNSIARWLLGSGAALLLWMIVERGIA